MKRESESKEVLCSGLDELFGSVWAGNISRRSGEEKLQVGWGALDEGQTLTTQLTSIIRLDTREDIG